MLVLPCDMASAAIRRMIASLCRGGRLVQPAKEPAIALRATPDEASGATFKSQSFELRSRSAFVITETELKLMAAAARMGLSSTPKNGYSTPAAMGTPIAL